MKINKGVLSLLPFVGLWTARYASAQDEGTTVGGIVTASDEHTTLLAILDGYEITPYTIADDFDTTIFAPTDAAFEKIDPKLYEDPTWVYHLLDVLFYHMTGGSVLSTDLEVGLTPTMYNGGTTNITSLDPTPMINTAKITGADIEATNGVVHVVDEVLLPFSATTNMADALKLSEQTSTLTFLLNQYGLTDALSGDGPFTLFAPSNAAFAALGDISGMTEEEVTNVLKYHVAPGIYTAKYGVTPGSYPAPTLTEDYIIIDISEKGKPMMEGEDEMMNATDTATMEEEVETAASKTLKQAKEEGEVEEEGEEIESDDANIVLNYGQAKPVYTDILVSNGVIHLIDAVLMPTDYKPPAMEEEEEEDKPGYVDGKPEILGFLSFVANDEEPDYLFPLPMCKGDCDKDEDCVQGAGCLQREGPQDPGSVHCDGDPDPTTDYCIPLWELYPNEEDPEQKPEGWEPPEEDEDEEDEEDEDEDEDEADEDVEDGGDAEEDGEDEEEEEEVEDDGDDEDDEEEDIADMPSPSPTMEEPSIVDEIFSGLVFSGEFP